MKILLMTTHLEMGGIPVYVTQLARGLKQRGHVPLVASGGGWLEGRLRQDRIPHVRIPCRTSNELSPLLWIQAFPMLLGVVRRERPELLHAHTRVTQVLAWALHRFTGVPYVTTCHGFYRSRVGRRLFPCWGKSVMAVSKATMDRLVKQYRLVSPRRVVSVENGIEISRFLEAPPPREVAAFRQANGLRGWPIIGSVARLSPVKGFEFLLKAMPALLKEFPRLQLVLVGDGPARADLVRLSYALKIQEQVVITHPVEDTRIPLSVMDCFAAPSLQEGFGLALVEAMAAGIPVVATQSGGPSEIIEHGRSGLLVSSGDAEGLGKAILTLLKDPFQRTAILQKAQERARTLFNMERVLHEVEQVYAGAVA